jgi:hypothetical protein
MKIPRRLLQLLGALLLAAATGLEGLAQSNANPPERMTYQGFLVDANGVALGNSAPRNYDVVFRIWNAQTGGTRQWSEQQTVTVDKGYFNVLLGEGSAVSGESLPDLSVVFSGNDVSDRFLSVTVKAPGLATTDVEIAPRLRLMTSPYAFLARKAVAVVNASGTPLIQGNGVAVQINGPVQSAGGNNRGNGATELQVSRFGNERVAAGNYSTISGGQNNAATGDWSTVSGGIGSLAQSDITTVGGGAGNLAGGRGATVSGGEGNGAGGNRSTIAGGSFNQAAQEASTVGGGFNNVASGPVATVAGGNNNTASADRAVVGGGGANVASGNDSVVPGGRNNTASGGLSLASGYRAKATHGGSFIWSDTTDADFGSVGVNETAFRATGGFRIVGARPDSMANLRQLSITDTQLPSSFSLKLGYVYYPNVGAVGVVEAVDNNNSTVLNINPRGGRVAVGRETTSPVSALEVNGTVTATAFAGDGTIPLGGIILWSGSVASIPSGWALCDGGTSNGRLTPDLRSRFIVGASGPSGPGGRTRFDPGNTGGSETFTLSVAQLPPHSHTYNDIYFSEADGGNYGWLGSHSSDRDNGPLTTPRTTDNTGSGAAIDARPPFFALAYIMRTR